MAYSVTVTELTTVTATCCSTTFTSLKLALLTNWSNRNVSIRHRFRHLLDTGQKKDSAFPLSL